MSSCSLVLLGVNMGKQILHKQVTFMTWGKNMNFQSLKSPEFSLLLGFPESNPSYQVSACWTHLPRLGTGSAGSAAAAGRPKGVPDDAPASRTGGRAVARRPPGQTSWDFSWEVLCWGHCWKLGITHLGTNDDINGYKMNSNNMIEMDKWVNWLKWVEKCKMGDGWESFGCLCQPAATSTMMDTLENPPLHKAWAHLSQAVLSPPGRQQPQKNPNARWLPRATQKDDDVIVLQGFKQLLCRCKWERHRWSNLAIPNLAACRL
jgi:hypothetical protein